VKGRIELKGMEFHSYHGCLPHERRDGARYLVDFSCIIDITAAAETDVLEDTLDYGEIYQLVSKEMSIPSNLLEHVAARVAKTVKSAFPSIESLSVTVSKEHPPVDGPVAWSSVTVEL